MSDLKLISSIAKQSLTIFTSAAEPDTCLWDRTERLVRNVKLICQMPEISKSGVQIDHLCLTVAAYFNYAGLACHLRTENKTARMAISKISGNGELLVEYSAEVAAEKLDGLISEEQIANVSRIIIESCDHFTKKIEAMILSDARNLDDMGAAGIFNQLRKHMAGGRGVSDVLASWQRKVDYQYWQARLRDGFRFNSVRILAEQRLAAAEKFMNQLAVEHSADDLQELSSSSTFIDA